MYVSIFNSRKIKIIIIVLFLFFAFKVLHCIHLTEEQTTPSDRVYIKYLFTELTGFLGLTNMKKRLTDPYVD